MYCCASCKNVVNCHVHVMFKSLVCRNYSPQSLACLSLRHKTNFGAIAHNFLLPAFFISTRFVSFSVIVRKYSPILAVLGCLWLFFWIAPQFVSICFVFYHRIFSVFAFHVSSYLFQLNRSFVVITLPSSKCI